MHLEEALPSRFREDRSLQSESSSTVLTAVIALAGILLFYIYRDVIRQLDWST